MCIGEEQKGMKEDMKRIDDEVLVKELGLSRELTEFSQIDARIYNDDSEYDWAIHVYPSIEWDDVMYFVIYDKCLVDDVKSENTKMARISMLTPEYITCTDSSKASWILNENERAHLYDILTADNGKIWDNMKYFYAHELNCYDSRKIDLGDLVMPDYRCLPAL